MARIRHTIFSVLSLTVLLCCLGVRGISQADNYQLQASIPYPAPAQSAVINQNLDGTTVGNALQTISGSCPIQNPADVVSIMRNGSSSGSTLCVAGNFSLQIMLVEGTNTLTPRIANASNIYGPDGSPITITLALPAASPPPVADSGPQPTSPTQEITATNAGANENLTIAMSQPFSVLSSINDVTITVAVGGGEHPYDITLNWGDGSVDTHHVDAAGIYSFSHTYQVPGGYKVHGWVHDVLGAFSEFDYAVLTANKAPTVTASNKTGGAKSRPLTWHSIAPYFIAGGLLAVLVAAYRLGIHHAVAQAARQTKAKARGKPLAKSKPRPKAKPVRGKR